MVLLEGGKAFPWKEDALSPPLFSKVRKIQCGLSYRLRRNQSGLIEEAVGTCLGKFVSDAELPCRTSASYSNSSFCQSNEGSRVERQAKTL